MKLLKINTNGQVTIPMKIREKLHCHIGDYFQVQVEGTVIKLVPTKIIDPSQTWFWTKEWQEGEKKADEDLRKGKYKKFKNVKEAVKHLKGISKCK